MCLGPSRGEADDDAANEGDRRTGEESGREAFTEKDSGQDGDQDGSEVDDQRCGAGIDEPFRGIERDAVDGEPKYPVCRDREQVAPMGQRWSPDERNSAEEGKADEQSAKGDRAGRKRLAGRPNSDKCRTPCSHSHQSGDEAGDVRARRDWRRHRGSGSHNCRLMAVWKIGQATSVRCRSSSAVSNGVTREYSRIGPSTPMARSRTNLPRAANVWSRSRTDPSCRRTASSAAGTTCDCTRPMLLVSTSPATGVNATTSPISSSNHSLGYNAPAGPERASPAWDAALCSSR